VRVRGANGVCVWGGTSGFVRDFKMRLLERAELACEALLDGRAGRGLLPEVVPGGAGKNFNERGPFQ
jgi:hypothetical protein